MKVFRGKKNLTYIIVKVYKFKKNRSLPKRAVVHFDKIMR